MTHFPIKTTLAALAFSASVGFALPAAAHSVHHGHHHAAHASWSHHASHRQAWHDGYARGFRDGHYAAATGELPGDHLVTGRSAYVAPGPRVIGNGGLLGLGILGGDGLLSTGVLDGQGALGIGVLGF